MLKSSVGARVLSAGSFFVLCSCLALGCDDGHEGHFAYYGQGPGHGPAPWSGAIQFEWSLAGSADSATSDDDAGALGSSSDDAGLMADASVMVSGSALQDACDAIGAKQFQALLLDQGTIVAAFQSPCAAGAATWRVGSNDYTATASLVTDDGVPVTATKAIPSFVVAPGEKQVIRLAFSKRATGS